MARVPPVPIQPAPSAISVQFKMAEHTLSRTEIQNQFGRNLLGKVQNHLNEHQGSLVALLVAVLVVVVVTIVVLLFLVPTTSGGAQLRGNLSGHVRRAE